VPFPRSLRRQLAAYSPLPPAAILGALIDRMPRGPGAVARAEELLAREFRAERAVLVDSGRSALRLAIQRSLPAEGRGKRVVALPAFQCYEVATAAVGVDCGMALYDIDPATLGPDMASLELALRAGASAVVIAPLYGVPVAWEPIAELVSRYRATAIEDAAQSHGASWKGAPLGSLGKISVVSFGRGKGWTGGGGGALLLRGAPAIHAAAAATLERPGAAAELTVVAATVLQALFGRARLYGIPASIPSLALGETRYHQPTPPRACSGFSAALIRRTLVAAADEATARRDNAELWMRILPAALLSRVPRAPGGGVAGYLRFPLRLRQDDARRALSEGRAAGVAPSYPLPLSELEAVRPRLISPDATYPGAAALARELVTLPTHSRVADHDRAVILRLAATWAGA
jgi:dTDP-4-amino-4,6-dideoxygalactose transaminase